MPETSNRPSPMGFGYAMFLGPLNKTIPKNCEETREAQPRTKLQKWAMCWH
ncbi:hypothetical protein SLEP1_g45667 [Rubroshorea leprosula]|uniref:Uncharacterized protein n=1 Tax=Rubroshorea leprosula TaxID=152421 RepID=A0AAV5LLF8_9ROSI|nr:hypothetical protein SLEP1_g45667 [Rubroshorea leprosula]